MGTCSSRAGCPCFEASRPASSLPSSHTGRRLAQWSNTRKARVVTLARIIVEGPQWLGDARHLSGPGLLRFGHVCIARLQIGAGQRVVLVYLSTSMFRPCNIVSIQWGDGAR
jgi:hypothetical protein